MPRVLVVEDDDVLASAIERALTARGFKASVASNGDTGYARLKYERCDVCVLDLMLPGMDGWEIIRAARDEGIGTPIIAVSGRASQSDRLKTLELGADDYVVKPVGMDELVARVVSAQRRGPLPRQVKRGQPLTFDDLFIDPNNVQAYLDGESARLTPTEFRLLYTLAQEPGRVLTRADVLKRAWKRPSTGKGRMVDGCIRQLREKIDERSTRNRFIHTRYGVGYMFEPVAKSEAEADASSNGHHGTAPQVQPFPDGGDDSQPPAATDLGRAQRRTSPPGLRAETLRAT